MEGRGSWHISFSLNCLLSQLQLPQGKVSRHWAPGHSQGPLWTSVPNSTFRNTWSHWYRCRTSASTALQVWGSAQVHE